MSFLIGECHLTQVFNVNQFLNHSYIRKQARTKDRETVQKEAADVANTHILGTLATNHIRQC